MTPHGSIPHPGELRIDHPHVVGLVILWYEYGMSAFKKVAVTIPVVTYRSLEKARAKLGKTRSEVVASAIKEWLRGLDADEQQRRYMEGYRRIPETAADAALIAAAAADWSPWEPGAPSRAAELRRARRK